MMSKFVYIRCFQAKGDEFPEFDHHFIDANDETDAYLLGGKLPLPERFDWLLNDYVVYLPTKVLAFL